MGKKKIIKLTQKDLSERINKVLKEQEELENQGKDVALGQDENGNFYVIDMDDPENPKLIVKTK